MSTADFSDPPPPYESADNSGPPDTYESDSESELGFDGEAGVSFDSDEFRAMLSRMSSPTLGSEVEDSQVEDFEVEDFEIEDFTDEMSVAASSTPSKSTTKASISSEDISEADDEWAPSDGYESASDAQESPSLPRRNLEIERVHLHYGHYCKNWMVETNAHETGGSESWRSSESHMTSYSEHKRRTFSVEMRDAVEYDPKGKGKQRDYSDIGSPMSLDLVME
ncbi:hypothetical protein FRC09_013892 [Ceratobasidium sp. 395]|nr:hypothetical protein FRC09_013892 [Ceratobasidium sp. 395]